MDRILFKSIAVRMIAILSIIGSIFALLIQYSSSSDEFIIDLGNVPPGMNTEKKYELPWRFDLRDGEIRMKSSCSYCKAKDIFSLARLDNILDLGAVLHVARVKNQILLLNSKGKIEQRLSLQ